MIPLNRLRLCPKMGQYGLKTGSLSPNDVHHSRISSGQCVVVAYTVPVYKTQSSMNTLKPQSSNFELEL